MKRVALVLALLAADPPDWPGYTAILWHYKGPPKDEKLAAAMKALSINGSHVDGLESSDFAASNGFRFYVDHAAGKGLLYLRKEDYQPLWDAFMKDRSPSAFVRPHCPNDPATVEKLRSLLNERVGKHAARKPVAYALDDEISITSYANPFDFCFCPHCLRLFAAWLRREYGDVAALNAAWGTSYARFEEARPMTTDEARARAEILPRGEWNFAPWADHREFMDRTLAQVVGDLVRYCAGLDPGRPAGFVGGQAPSAFGGYDWSLLVPEVTFLETYDIGSARSIVRSLDRRSIPIVSTYFPTAAGDEWKNVYKAFSLFAHGDDGAILYSANDAFADADAGKPTPFVTALAPALKELASPALEPVRRAAPKHDGVAILYSPASVRVHWMLDSWDDKTTWPKRYGSFEKDHSSIQADFESWRKLLEDLFLGYRFVSSDEVEAGVLGTGEFRALVLPKAIALSDAEARAIGEFALGGGLVIADGQPGLFDERAKARGLVGALDRLFGVRRSDLQFAERYGKLKKIAREDFQGLVVLEPSLRATAEATHPRAIADGVPVVTTRVVGEKGRAVYLNLGVLAYRETRLAPGPGPAESLRTLVADVLYRAGVTPSARAEAPSQPGTRLEIVRTAGEGGVEFLALLQNGQFLVGPTGKTDLAGVAPGPPISVRVILSEERRVTNLRTGKLVGEGRTFGDALVPTEAGYYRLDPIR